MQLDYDSSIQRVFYEDIIRETADDCCVIKDGLIYDADRLTLKVAVEKAKMYDSKETQDAIKIYNILKTKECYIKSNSGRYMLLKVSMIYFKGDKFMVNGYCNTSDNSRCVPLDKVYLQKEEIYFE